MDSTTISTMVLVALFIALLVVCLYIPEWMARRRMRRERKLRAKDFDSGGSE